VRALIAEELAAGFYNIDIDASTLVDLQKPCSRTAAGEHHARRRFHPRSSDSTSLGT